MVYEPWVLSNILSWLFPSTSDTFEITHNIFMAHSPHQVIYRQANSHSRNVVQTGKEWSGQQDLNLRPSAPKADALPDCAMPRQNHAYRIRVGATPHGTRNITDRPSARQTISATISTGLTTSPSGFLRRIFQHHTICRELIANAIRFFPVLGFARRSACRDKRIDLRIGQLRFRVLRSCAFRLRQMSICASLDSTLAQENIRSLLRDT